MAEDEMDEAEVERQHALSRAAARGTPTPWKEYQRTVVRQVDYGAQMYASGKADGAREEREAVVQALQQEVRQVLAEEASWTFGDVASLVSEIIHGFLRGEHRKEPDHG